MDMSENDKKQCVEKSITSKNREQSDIDSSMGKSSSGVPTPPPAPTKKEPDSSVLLKKVNWDKIEPQKLSKDCLWSKKQQITSNEELLSKDLFTGLVENFSSKPPKRSVFAVKSSISLQVIDTKSAQTLLIMLRVQFKKSTYEQIKKYIFDCDVSMLNVDFIDDLIKCLPQPYQIKQLCELKQKNAVALSDAETFLACICEIERLVPRLLSIKFKSRFNDMITRIMPEIEVGTLASEEVISSEKFAKVLNLILSIGNIMNSGSSNGQAVGFDLASLQKLNDVKSTNNKKTLLIFLVETISENFPELLNFGDELMHVQRAARLNVDYINEILKEMKTSSKDLMDELQNDKIDAKFIEIMSPFALQSVEKVELLETMMNQMQNTYKNVAEYFAFDVNCYPMATCFSNIQKFKHMFNIAKGMTSQTTHCEASVQEKNTAPIDEGNKSVQAQNIKDICRPLTVKLHKMTVAEITTRSRPSRSEHRSESPSYNITTRSKSKSMK